MKNSIKKLMLSAAAASLCAVSMGSTLSAGAAEIRRVPEAKLSSSVSDSASRLTNEDVIKSFSDRLTASGNNSFTPDYICGNDPVFKHPLPFVPKPKEETDRCGTPHKLPVSGIRGTDLIITR